MTNNYNGILPLAEALTAKTRQLCLGLEDGSADLYDLVTPTTAELLRWWFLEDICLTRRCNFHPGQKQAILNGIVAHEVLAAGNGVWPGANGSMPCRLICATRFHGTTRWSANGSLTNGGRRAPVWRSCSILPGYAR